ncbi:MAG TPA: hypothetical protein VEA44_02580 [Caulobacter sp.]|nr:hypothetical protein [Caulobacter sp.]
MRSWIWRFSAVFVLAAGILSAGLAGAEDPLTRAEFRDRYVAELARAAPKLKVVVVSETELKIIGEGGEEQTQYLDNPYRMYRNDPAALDETLARFVRVVLAADQADGANVTAKNVIVLVRPAEFVEGYEAMVREKGDREKPSRLAHRPLPGGLAAIIAADQPDAYQYPPEVDIVQALGPIDGAWKMALANTAVLIGKPDGEEVGGLVLISTPGGSASSLLVVEDFWVQLEKAGLGAPVVMLSSRDTLVIGFEGRKDSLRDLKLVARKLVEEPGEFDEPMLSSALLAWRDGRWELYADYPYR